MPFCSSCGTEITGEVKFCTGCGLPVSGATPDPDVRSSSQPAKSEYLYRMVQVPPTISVRAREERGNEAATYLQTLADQQAAQGWDFYRVDRIGVITQPGCLASLFGARQYLIEYFVVTFRRRNM